MISDFSKASKKFLLAIFILALTCSAGWSENIYSNPENWAYFAEGSGPVDLFLIAPLVDVNNVNNEFNMSLSDDKTKAKFLGALNRERGIDEELTRMYSPYYRQKAASIYTLMEENEHCDIKKYTDIAYADIKAAFSYYLEHENNNRPLILAGFSQGAEMCYYLLRDFFDNEELYSRLVAVYAIGMPLTVEMTEKFPYIKPAQTSDDLGVVITFGSEAPDFHDGSIVYPKDVKAHAINPLNWRTDSTPAGQDLNLGACFTDYSGNITREIKNFCGGYLDTERGVIKVTRIISSDYPQVIPFLPEGFYHVYDYLFFYRNLQENVKTRILKALGSAD